MVFRGIICVRGFRGSDWRSLAFGRLSIMHFNVLIKTSRNSKRFQHLRLQKVHRPGDDQGVQRPTEIVGKKLLHCARGNSLRLSSDARKANDNSILRVD